MLSNVIALDWSNWVMGSCDTRLVFDYCWYRQNSCCAQSKDEIRATQFDCSRGFWTKSKWVCHYHQVNASRFISFLKLNFSEQLLSGFGMWITVTKFSNLSMRYDVCTYICRLRLIYIMTLYWERGTLNRMCITIRGWNEKHTVFSKICRLRRNK